MLMRLQVLHRHNYHQALELGTNESEMISYERQIRTSDMMDTICCFVEELEVRRVSG